MTPPSALPSAGGEQVNPIPSLTPEPPGTKNQSRHDSKVSVATHSSRRSHKEYLDTLMCPTKEQVERISDVQTQKEKEISQKRLGGAVHTEKQKEAPQKRLSGNYEELDSEERERAAELIQRNYRGHRERRMMAGLSLDPSTRWKEAIKEMRYRELTKPRAKADGGVRASTDSNTAGLEGAKSEINRMSSAARQNWKKIGLITRRAGADEDSDTETGEEDENTPEQEREAARKKRLEQKLERQKAAKVMDLNYWLEMVDQKHRYGSNLRTYHEEWKKSKTTDNFFYWLDYGEGRYIDCQACPREQLDREQVRYLSKEERLSYLVKIDKEGRLCWAKNGSRIDTTEKFKDSIHGIVPDTDDTPAYRAPSTDIATRLLDHQISSETSSDSGDESDEATSAANKYASPEFDNARGIKKVKHVSAATIFNKLLRGTIKKNTWIFVADTSFRLYVGIKQSGSFQHSSFLHGSRISAAGSIVIKKGRLSKLSPLSGHYRPPVSNFRVFVHSLEDAGVDMSHVSISRSYAMLVGLEAYVRARRRGKKMIQALVHHRDKITSPEELAEREDAERDKSESAARERRFLELKEKAEREAREQNRADLRLKEKLRIKPRSHDEVAVGETKEVERDPDIQAPGPGPENAIAPEGTRDI